MASGSRCPEYEKEPAQAFPTFAEARGPPEESVTPQRTTALHVIMLACKSPNMQSHVMRYHAVRLVSGVFVWAAVRARQCAQIDPMAARFGQSGAAALQ